jgi:hypothetical protein
MGHSWRRKSHEISLFYFVLFSIDFSDPFSGKDIDPFFLSIMGMINGNYSGPRAVPVIALVL